MLRKYGILLVLPVSMIFFYFIPLSNKNEINHITEAPVPPESSHKINYALNIADELNTYGQVYRSAVGIGGENPYQYKRYQLLKQVASNNDLVQLTESISPVVKAYAFNALIERKYRNIISIFERHLMDKSEFKVYAGCIISSTYINIYYLSCISSLLNRDSYEKYKRIILAMYRQDDFNLRLSGLISF